MLSNQVRLSQPNQAAPLAVLEAAQSAKYGLMSAISSTHESGALPNKDNIVPNQKTWMETAAQMGVKGAPKRKQLPEECGLTKHCIGATKGKRHHIHSDLYARGERLGKRANPNTLSTVATADACAHKPPSTAGASACTAVPAHELQFIVICMLEASDRVSGPIPTHFLPQQKCMCMHVRLLPLPVPVPPLQYLHTTPILSQL